MASAAGNSQILNQELSKNLQPILSFFIRYFLSGVSDHADKHERALQLMKAHKSE